jgi:O-acetyl-ADP-ribose deacetylase (regulator of RNase III)
MSKVVKGDLVQLAQQGAYDVVVQGCNCMCQMGKGLALQLKKAYPECYEADLKTVKGDWNKLGTLSYAQVGNLVVVNAYTQYDWKGWWDGLVLSYPWAVYEALKEVKYLWGDKKVAYPKLGCGLANGNWDEMYPLVLDALDGVDNTLVLYDM